MQAIDETASTSELEPKEKTTGKNAKIVVMVLALILGINLLMGYLGMMVFSGFGSSSAAGEFLILAAISFLCVIFSIVGIVVFSKNNATGFLISILSLLMLAFTLIFVVFFGPAADQRRNLDRLNSNGGGELIPYTNDNY